jgi:hypothetical protein
MRIRDGKSRIRDQTSRIRNTAFLSHAPINKPPGSRRVTKFTPAQKVTGQ